MSMPRLGPFGVESSRHCAFALVSSRLGATRMTNRGFEIPKWKVILSFPRWMDERGHNESRNSRVARLGVPHDHSLVLRCPIPTRGALHSGMPSSPSHSRHAPLGWQGATTRDGSHGEQPDASGAFRHEHANKRLPLLIPALPTALHRPPNRLDDRVGCVALGMNLPSSRGPSPSKCSPWFLTVPVIQL